MNTADVKHKTIFLAWFNQNRSCTTMQLQDRSYNEALEYAKLSGYLKPKWYQFWKFDIMITMVD